MRTLSDREALLVVADNIEAFWGEIASVQLETRLDCEKVREIAEQEAQHVREIAYRLPALKPNVEEQA